MNLKTCDKKKTFWIENVLILTDATFCAWNERFYSPLFILRYLFYLRAVQWGNGYEILLCNAVLHTLVAGLLVRSQYPEGPAPGHLGTGFSWFPSVYKRMLRWFPRLQVATACSSCNPPDLNFLDPYCIFMYMRCNHCHRATAHLQLNILLLLLLLLLSSVSPLCRVSTLIFLRPTMSLGNTVLQLFWYNYSCCVYC